MSKQEKRHELSFWVTDEEERGLIARVYETEPVAPAGAAVHLDLFVSYDQAERIAAIMAENCGPTRRAA